MTTRLLTLSCLGIASALFVTNASGQPMSGADGWISHAETSAEVRPIVLLFRRDLALSGKPTAFPVEVSGDNRFILFVNGRRVAAGPSAGDISHWRFSSLDLAPYLKRGSNTIAAVVWNGVKPPAPPPPPNATAAQRQSAMGAEILAQTAPLFQQSAATGFRLQGRGAAAQISTSQPGWRVKVDRSRTFTNGFRQVLPNYYAAGAPETIDASKEELAWQSPPSAAASNSARWTDAVAAPAAARRTMVADRLPQQRYAPVAPGAVVRTDLAGGQAFPAKPATVPANTHVKLLLRRDAMVSAYPELRTSGGRDATIKLTYAEALFDAKGKKANRNLLDGREPKGITDTFLADGKPTTFWPLWWRTWRYMQLDVTTKAEPLELEGLTVHETGYPFTQVGRFESSDPELNRIWQIGWRTALVDAHETYMDSSFWEQLQYVGDTRLQMLISYAVSGDARLAEQAIDAFAASRGASGLTQGAYPSRNSNVIAPFSLLWIGMLDDWRMQQPDRTVIARNLPRMRGILAWFAPTVSETGLLAKNAEWNFVDWVGQSSTDRTKFPSYSADGETCLVSAIYLGALQQAARLEAHAGDAALGRADAEAAQKLSQAINARCWSAERKLFADNPDKQVFSQQMNALAVLYGVVPKSQGQELLNRITLPRHGIDAPEGMYESSYYFAWYLVRAFEQANLGDRYGDLLQTWRDLLQLDYTTWPEKRGDTRSDTHAWSAHPTADLLGIVAGIQPGAPGYAKVRIAPNLGTLQSLNAVAVTPKGPVEVDYRISKGKLRATIQCPKGLTGTFVWRDRTYPLKAGTNQITVLGSVDIVF